MVEDLLGRPDLHDASGVDHGDAVGERQRLFAVVGDVHRSDANALLQGAQLVAELQPHLVVEVRHRLVEEQYVGAHGQRPPERHALALAAGKLRHRSRPVTFELEQLQHLLDPRGDRVLLPAAHAQAVTDVVGHAHVRPQRVGLEHHRRAARLGGKVRDVAALDPD